MLFIKEFIKIEEKIENYYQSKEKKELALCKQVYQHLIDQYSEYNIGYFLKIDYLLDFRNNEEIQRIFSSLIEKKVLMLNLSWPFDLLDKNHKNYNIELETIILDFLKLRKKHILAIFSNSDNKLHLQKELFLICDALKDEDELELLSKKLIAKDYLFIETQRFYSNNSNAPHRNKMNKYFKKYRLSMQNWNNTIEEKVEIFTKVFSEIKYNSASLKISNIDDWDSFAFGYLPQLLQSKNKLEFYEILIQMVNKIGDDHNNLIMPYDIFQSYTNPKVEIIFIKNRFYVKTDYLTGTIKINSGDEIIEIEGIETSEYLKVNQNKFPFVEHYHFHPRLAAFYNLCNVLLTYPKDSSLEVKFRRTDNSTYNLTFLNDKENEDKKENSSQEFVSSKLLENKILYIEITQFSGCDIYKVFKDEILKYDLKEIKGVIFDVRRNTGGSSAYGDQIFSHFIDKEFKNYFMDYNKIHIPHHILDGIDDLKLYDYTILQPSKEFKIDCPTVILTSPYSGSATEDFVFLFKYYKRGKIIGLPTSGSTGNALNLILKGGGCLRVNLDVSLYFSCKGIKPDIFVDYSILDLLNGNDPQLLKALGYLANLE